jgi:hypothetical protein
VTYVRRAAAGAPLKRKLKATDTNSWHAEEVAWLKAAIKKAKKAGEAVVVLTHHLPSNNSPNPNSHYSIFSYLSLIFFYH